MLSTFAHLAKQEIDFPEGGKEKKVLFSLSGKWEWAYRKKEKEIGGFSLLFRFSTLSFSSKSIPSPFFRRISVSLYIFSGESEVRASWARTP